MVTQTPWIERKFEFNFPAGVFPVIIERLKGTLSRIEYLCKEPDEKLSFKKDDKWSVKEVIGHLFDLEELWNGRITDFLDHKETLRAADMSNEKTKAADHNSKNIKELVVQFREARLRLISRVKDLDDETVCITALHPRLQKPMRLIDSLFFTAEHDDHELTKIRRLLEP
jgi:uncharacterized damage-inducible protein DinB